VILCLVVNLVEVGWMYNTLMNFVHIFGRDLRMNSIKSAVLILLTKDEVEGEEILRQHHLPGKLNAN